MNNNESNTGVMVMGFIVVLVVLIGGYYLFFAGNAPANNGGTNVDVTVPAGSGDAGGPAY